MTVATGIVSGPLDIYVDEEEDAPVFYCTAMVFSGNYYEPAEYCENEVDEDGETCGMHSQEDPDDYYDSRDDGW